MRKQNDLAKVKQTALLVIFCSNPKKAFPPLQKCGIIVP